MKQDREKKGSFYCRDTAGNTHANRRAGNGYQFQFTGTKYIGKDDLVYPIYTKIKEKISDAGIKTKYMTLEECNDSLVSILELVEKYAMLMG